MRCFVNGLFAAAVACILASAVPASAGEGGVHVMDAWVRAAPPTMKMTAGYLSVMNMSDHELALVGVKSPDFDHVEMHVTRIENGVASMQEVKQVTVPAGGTLAFAPGGMHLMMFGLKPAAAAKGVASLDLEFADGSTVHVDAPIRKAAGEIMQHMHMSHGS